MWHRITKKHWFTPHIIGYDKYGFDEYDGCSECMGITTKGEKS